MISKSLCRAAIHNCPPSSALATATRHATSSVAAVQRTRPGAGHQRRPSSSQASSPPGGHKPPSSDQTAAAGAERRAPGGRLTRRKAKDATASQDAASLKPQDEAFANAPAVPSTQHLHLADVKVSDFFALHRPISVTQAFPPQSSSTLPFDSIFDVPAESSRGHRPQEVIYTIQSAANALDGKPSEITWQTLQQNAEASGTHHLDGQPQQHSPQSLEKLVKEFRPFRPPPPPVAFEDVQENTTADRERLNDYRARQMNKSRDALTPQERQKLERIRAIMQPDQAENVQSTQRSYTTTLHIDETTHANGSKTYVARASPIIEAAADLDIPELEPSSSPSVNHSRRKMAAARNRARMAAEHTTEPATVTASSDGVTMHLISVKRQRKLKMKKHKYKKLMRRTRNLRIREGRN